MTPEVQNPDQPLVSIERVVAFVLGPAVIAGSGTLSAWLSTKIGIQVSASEITGAFATGGVAAGGLVYKWLHGRQKAPILIRDVFGNTTHVLNTVTNTLESLGIPKEITVGAAKTIEDHVETIAQQTANMVVEKLPIVTSGWRPPTQIPPAVGDPAPATPVAAAIAVPDAIENPPSRPQSAATPEGGAPSTGITQAPPPASS
jgi:hypothetical protein